jgi:hypothetical protein
VGRTVADLDGVTAFFVALGLEVEGRMFVKGEFLDTVCGISNSRTEIVMLKPPHDGTRLELSSFVNRRESSSTELDADLPGQLALLCDRGKREAGTGDVRLRGSTSCGGVLEGHAGLRRPSDPAGV